MRAVATSPFTGTPKRWSGLFITLLVGLATLGASPASGQPVATIIVHAPPLTVAGKAMEISAQVDCVDGPGQCSVVLGYRRTSGSLLGGGEVFTEVPMALDPAVPALTGVETYVGTIPSPVVTTAGVDYYIDATDSVGWTRWPVGAAWSSAFYRSDVMMPPEIVHVPPPVAVAGKPLRLLFQAPCAPDNDCEATVWYRPAPRPDILVQLPPLLPGEPSGWDTAVIRRLQVTSDDLDVIGFEAEIPDVEATGVEYLIRVTDGDTTNYWPGTPSEVWAGPSVALAAYHVHALTAPVITHVPVPGALAGSQISLSWTVTCSAPVAGNCRSSAFWRHGTRDEIIVPPPEYQEVPATLRLVARQDALWVFEATATLPAGSVAGELEQYYLWVTDGKTNSYSPGTTYLGFSDGIKVGQAVPYDVVLLGVPAGVEARP